jgi:hypothetical protein
MSLDLRQRTEALQQARHAVRAVLEARPGTQPDDARRLAGLRTVVEGFAKQTDALIAAMTAGRGVLSAQVSEAEDLRAFFRLTVGCIEALLDASPGEPSRQARDASDQIDGQGAEPDRGASAPGRRERALCASGSSEHGAQKSPGHGYGHHLCREKPEVLA